jgi:hypothetical protein
MPQWARQREAFTPPCFCTSRATARQQLSTRNPRGTRARAAGAAHTPSTWSAGASSCACASGGACASSSTAGRGAGASAGRASAREWGSRRGVSVENSHNGSRCSVRLRSRRSHRASWHPRAAPAAHSRATAAERLEGDCHTPRKARGRLCEHAPAAGGPTAGCCRHSGALAAATIPFRAPLPPAGLRKSTTGGTAAQAPAARNHAPDTHLRTHGGELWRAG